MTTLYAEDHIDLLNRLASAAHNAGKHDIEYVLDHIAYRIRQTQALAPIMMEYLPPDLVEQALESVEEFNPDNQFTEQAFTGEQTAPIQGQEIVS